MPKVVKRNLLVGLLLSRINRTKARSSKPPTVNLSAPTSSGGMDSTATFMAMKLSPMRMAARTRGPSAPSDVPLPLTELNRYQPFVASDSRALKSSVRLLLPQGYCQSAELRSRNHMDYRASYPY